MALFSISDLHLSFTAKKPMSIFGEHWEDYEQQMAENWNNIVTENDAVIICGDTSWTTYLKDAVADFAYINQLKGNKYIIKGNHDYWWTTLSKMNKKMSEHGFSTINFLQNNSYLINDISICGTRGYIALDSCQSAEDIKIYNRELQRLELSLEAAKGKNHKEIIVALHYPPDKSFRDLMASYGVKKCLFGHLHAKGHDIAPKGIIDSIEHIFVSCDYLNFTPKLIVP